MVASVSAYPKRSSFSSSPRRTHLHHERRHSSGYKRSSPYDNSPLPVTHTSCPKDINAFSYDPQHLAAWYMPHELWIRLPRSLQSSLMALQHAGAAVLTGFERLERLGAGLPDLAEEGEENEGGGAGAPADETFPGPGPGSRRHHSRQDSLTSNASESLFSGSLPSLTHSAPNSPATSAFTPAPASPIPEYALLSTTTAKQQSEAEAVPYSFSPLLNPKHPTGLGLLPPSPGRHTPPPLASPPFLRPFSTTSTVPTVPATAYYHAELSHLRSDALVRLRHAALGVDAEWAECRRLGDVGRWEGEFEEWWGEMRSVVRGLDARGREVADGAGR